MESLRVSILNDKSGVYLYHTEPGHTVPFLGIYVEDINIIIQVPGGTAYRLSGGEVLKLAWGLMGLIHLEEEL